MGVVELLLFLLQPFPGQLDPWLGPGGHRAQLVAINPGRSSHLESTHRCSFSIMQALVAFVHIS